MVSLWLFILTEEVGAANSSNRLPVTIVEPAKPAGVIARSVADPAFISADVAVSIIPAVEVSASGR